VAGQIGSLRVGDFFHPSNGQSTMHAYAYAVKITTAAGASQFTVLVLVVGAAVAHLLFLSPLHLHASKEPPLFSSTTAPLIPSPSFLSFFFFPLCLAQIPISVGGAGCVRH
jgi:hypothetical protein